MTRTSVNFWIDFLLLLVMLCLAATGGLMDFVLPPGTGRSDLLFGLGRHDYGDIHSYLALSAVLLAAVHVFLHWNWVCCVVAKAVGRATPQGTAQLVSGLALVFGVVLVLGGGLWWASTRVERDAMPRPGRGRGRHTLHGGSRGDGASAVYRGRAQPKRARTSLGTPPTW